MNKDPIFKPLNEEQRTAYEKCHANSITFLTGPAGCSKTYTAVAYAASRWFAGKTDQIIFTRPAIEACGENIGYLPGTAKEKMGEYMHPMWDNLYDFCGKEDMDRIRTSIKVVPLGFIRGRTFKQSVVIMDEAQNANAKQIKTFLTRIGRGTKMILCGDTTQSDINAGALGTIGALLRDLPGVDTHEFSQSASYIRHPLLPMMIDRFEESNL